MKKIIILGSFIIFNIYIYAFPKIQTIGVAGLVSENIYKGQENIVIPFPLVNLHYQNFYINGKNIGCKVYKLHNFQVSFFVDPLAGYFEGFTTKGASLPGGYKNIGNRSSQVMGGVDFFFDVTLDIKSQLYFETGRNGYKGDLDFYKPFNINDRMTLIPSIGAKYFDKTYTTYYFGISEKEFENNINIQDIYNPSNSYSINSSLTLDYAITENNTIDAVIGFNHLSNQITNSPIVERGDIVYGGVGYRYSF